VEASSNIFVYYREEEMLPYAFCYLHELFPKWKGWQLHFLRNKDFSYPDFVIERVEGNSITRVIALVCMDRLISTYHITEMIKYEKLFRIDRHYSIEKVLIVPAGCDASAASSDFKIIYLKEFHLQTG